MVTEWHNIIIDSTHKWWHYGVPEEKEKTNKMLDELRKLKNDCNQMYSQLNTIINALGSHIKTIEVRRSFDGDITLNELDWDSPKENWRWVEAGVVASELGLDNCKGNTTKIGVAAKYKDVARKRANGRRLLFLPHLKQEEN